MITMVKNLYSKGLEVLLNSDLMTNIISHIDINERSLRLYQHLCTCCKRGLQIIKKVENPELIVTEDNTIETFAYIKFTLLNIQSINFSNSSGPLKNLNGIHNVLPDLTKINLSFCVDLEQLDDVRYYKNLTHLDLSFCFNITIQHIQWLKPTIQKLDLTCIDHIETNEEEVNQLKKQLPNTKIDI